MMKFISSLAFLFICFPIWSQNVIYYSALPQDKSGSYDYYQTMHPEVLANDLSYLLTKATKNQWKTSSFNNVANKGVYLIIDTTLQLGNEAGRVQIEPNRIVIKAKYVNGLSFALYRWLYDLNFRFYIPGKNWEEIPNISNLYQPLDTVYAPHTSMRMFTSSGGMFPIKGLDPNQNFKKEWYDFYRRNGMGYEFYRIDGHVGEKFNQENRAEIERDPKILAPINGSRQYNLNGKLDPTYAKGISLFSQWINKRVRNEFQNAYPYTPSKKYTSVDPGDGLNYCHTIECRSQFPGIPDQMFYIAEQVLNEIDKNFKNIGVSTMAYTERADTPHRKIHPMIHTLVVPGAYQYISTQAELMKRWSIKTNNFSQYEFLNIGVWQYDQPFYNLNQQQQYINYVLNLGAKGFSVEASSSPMAGGIPSWFFLHLLEEPNINVDSTLQDISVQLFGNAYCHILPVLKLFYNQSTHIKSLQDWPTFEPDELGFILHQIHLAENVTKLSVAIKNRLTALKAYAVYLCMHYELHHDLTNKQLSEKDKSHKSQRSDQLLAYIWQIYPLNILHTTQVNDLIKTLSSQSSLWDYKKNDFSRFNVNANAIVQNHFNEFRKKYTNTYLEDTWNEGQFKVMMKYNADSLLIQTRDEEAYKNFSYPIAFYADQPTKLRIRYETGKNGIDNYINPNLGMIGVESNDYSFMQHHFLNEANKKGEIIIDIPTSGFYQLYLAQWNATPHSFVIYPEKCLFYLQKKQMPKNGILLQQPEKSNYDNAFMAVFKPQSKKLTYKLSQLPAKITCRFFDIDGKLLNQNLYGEMAEVNTGDNNTPVYFTNEVDRWQPTFFYTSPYIFILKRPNN